jgi:hypothetical protein
VSVHFFQRIHIQPTLVAAAVMLSLSACDGSSHSNEGKPATEHKHEKVQSAGRLVLSAVGNNQVHVYDVQQQKQLNSFDSKFPIQAIYASPNQRYAVLIQRTDNKVSFVDGGLWQEDHGSHMHDYQQGAKLLSFQLNGPAPTHYEAHGEQAAIFFDGVASPMQASSVQVLTDASIGSGKLAANLALALNMHGTAEPRGKHLLTTYRPADAANTLPTQVEWYQQTANGYQLKEKFAEQCPGLHGSFSNKDYSLFGCTDGVLVVEQKADQMVASKIANPTGMTGRIGTVTGHKNLSTMIGFAGQDQYLLDPVAKTMTLVNWRGTSTATRTAFAMSGDGDYFVQLDNSGKLIVQDTGAGYSIKGSLQLVSKIDTANPPVISANLQNDDIFITDPANQQLQKVDLKTMTNSTLKLDFTPAKMSWVGIAQPAK